MALNRRMEGLGSLLEPVIFVRGQLEADLEGIRSWVIQNMKFRNLDSFGQGEVNTKDNKQ